MVFISGAGSISMNKNVEAIIQRIGFLGFVSFFMTIVSVFIDSMILAPLSLSPSAAVTSSNPSLSVLLLLPTLFFGSCFLFFGIITLFPNSIVRKSAGIFSALVGVVMALIGAGFLALGIITAIQYQPYYLFFYVTILVFFIFPKGIWKSEKAKNIVFYPDCIAIKKMDDSSVKHYLKDITMISLYENFQGITIYSQKESYQYETALPFENLKKQVEALSFISSEQLIASGKGKSLEEILGENLADNKYQFRKYKPFRDSPSREQYFIPRFNQWLEADEQYVFHIQFKNPSVSRGFQLHINPYSLIKPIGWVIILLLVLYAGYVFIPHTEYKQDSDLQNGSQVDISKNLKLNDSIELTSYQNSSKKLRLTIIEFGGKQTFDDGRVINCASVSITDEQTILTNSNACEYQRVFSDLFVEQVFVNKINLDSNTQNSTININVVK